MNDKIKSICVFCGSSDDVDQYYLDEAFKLGVLLAEKEIRLVYGAGSTGLMGAVADGTLSCGGEVLGIVPDNLFDPKLIHNNLTKLEVSPSIHARKARMHETSDAFISLPGGFGTMDELFETITWAQINLHSKPIGLLNTKQFYDPVAQLIDHLHAQKFIYDEHKILIIKEEEPETLLERIFRFEAPDGLDRWMSREG